MLYKSGELAGTVRYTLYRDEAYFVGIQLEGDSQWSAAEFLPEHLLNPDHLLPGALEFARDVSDEQIASPERLFTP
jgi:hypothetical protein